MNGTSKYGISKKLWLSRNTVKKYMRKFTSFGLTHKEFEAMNDSTLETQFLSSNNRIRSERFLELEQLFPSMHKKILRTRITQLSCWEKYIAQYPNGYGYTQFNRYYTNWKGRLQENGEAKSKYEIISSIPAQDMETLKRWKRSSDKRKWEKAVVIMVLA